MITEILTTIGIYAFTLGAVVVTVVVLLFIIHVFAECIGIFLR